MKEARQLQICSSEKITASQNGSSFVQSHSPCPCPPPFPHKSTVKKWKKMKVIFFSVASGCREFMLLLVQLGAQTDTGSHHLLILNAIRFGFGCPPCVPLETLWASSIGKVDVSLQMNHCRETAVSGEKNLVRVGITFFLSRYFHTATCQLAGQCVFMGKLGRLTS